MPFGTALSEVKCYLLKILAAAWRTLPSKMHLREMCMIHTDLNFTKGAEAVTTPGFFFFFLEIPELLQPLQKKNLWGYPNKNWDRIFHYLRTALFSSSVYFAIIPSRRLKCVIMEENWCKQWCGRGDCLPAVEVQGVSKCYQ